MGTASYFQIRMDEGWFIQMGKPYARKNSSVVVGLYHQCAIGNANVGHAEAEPNYTLNSKQKRIVVQYHKFCSRCQRPLPDGADKQVEVLSKLFRLEV